MHVSQLASASNGGVSGVDPLRSFVGTDLDGKKCPYLSFITPSEAAAGGLGEPGMFHFGAAPAGIRMPIERE